MSDKIEVLDFVINVLKEHEKALSECVSRLEDSIKKLEERMGEEVEKPAKLRIELANWREFKRKASKPESAYYKLNDYLQIEVVKNGKIFRYREELPSLVAEAVMEEGRLKLREVFVKSLNDIPLILNMKLSCGFKPSIKSSILKLSENSYLVGVSFEVDKNILKNWLSRELGVSTSEIFEGSPVIP